MNECARAGERNQGDYKKSMNEQSIQIAVGSPEYFLIRDLLEFGRDVYRGSAVDSSALEGLAKSMGMPHSTIGLVAEGLFRMFDEPSGPTSVIGQYMTENLRKAARPVVVTSFEDRIRQNGLDAYIQQIEKLAEETVSDQIARVQRALDEASDRNEQIVPAAEIEPPVIELIDAAPAPIEPAPIIEPLTVDQRPARDLLIEILKTTDQSMRAPLVTIALWKRYGRRPNYPTHVGGELNRLSRDRSTGIVSVGRGFYKYVEPSKPAAPPVVTSTVSRETCNQCGKLFPLKDLGEHKRQAHPISDRPDMREERSHTGSSLGNPR